MQSYNLCVTSMSRLDRLMIWDWGLGLDRCLSVCLDGKLLIYDRSSICNGAFTRERRITDHGWLTVMVQSISILKSSTDWIIIVGWSSLFLQEASRLKIKEWNGMEGEKVKVKAGARTEDTA